jgi:hypothetical protein
MAGIDRRAISYYLKGTCGWTVALFDSCEWISLLLGVCVKTMGAWTLGAVPSASSLA